MDVPILSQWSSTADSHSNDIVINYPLNNSVYLCDAGANCAIAKFAMFLSICVQDDRQSMCVNNAIYHAAAILAATADQRNLYLCLLRTQRRKRIKNTEPETSVILPALTLGDSLELCGSGLLNGYVYCPGALVSWAYGCYFPYISSLSVSLIDQGVH